MDEPTNHLDIASREMLESALDEFEGTIIAVSHDRYFLDRVADKLLVIGTDELGNRRLGKTEFVIGDPAYTAYAALVRQRVEAQKQANLEANRSSNPKSEIRNPKSRAPRSAAPEELKRFNKYSVGQLEEMIMELEREINEMKERFGDAEIYKNPARLAELQRDYTANTTELDLLYRAYDRRTSS
jgi:ATP-binding cassette subfamily F protein 3